MATVPRLSAPASLDDMLLARLAMLIGSAGSLVKRLCEAQFGITRREWGVLARVAQGDGPTSSELALQMHTDRARTSRAISSLVAKKLIARARHRQRKALVLTDTGRALYEGILPHTRSIHHELLGALDGPADVQRLAEMIGALQAQADRMVARRQVDAGVAPVRRPG